MLSKQIEAVQAIGLHIGPQAKLVDAAVFLKLANSAEGRMLNGELREGSGLSVGGFEHLMERMVYKYHLFEYELGRNRAGERWVRLDRKGRALAAHLYQIEHGE